MSRHQRIWIEAVLWVIAEIIFSASTLDTLALDTLADYSEYLANQRNGIANIAYTNKISPDSMEKPAESDDVAYLSFV
jgi:hypothetical protein